MRSVKKILQSNRGVALITVLLIVSILIAVAVELNRSSRSGIYDAANTSDGIKLTYMAKSGFYAGAALLVNSPAGYVSLQDDWARTELLSQRSKGLFPDGYFIVNIEDETGKIPLNRLVAGKDFDPNIKKILLRLLTLPEFGLDERKAGELVDAIKDWIDADSDVTGSGAESSYYESLASPYAAKNAALDCIEELLMVKGITRDIFAGTKEKPGLAQYVTVYGDGPININTAPKMVLRSLSANISPEIAEKMDQYRKSAENDLSDPLWYKKVPELAREAINPVLITTKSSYFKISSSGKLNDMTRNVSGVIKKYSDRKAFQIMNWRLE